LATICVVWSGTIIKKIEAKWAKIWEKNNTWKVDLAKAKKSPTTTL